MNEMKSKAQHFLSPPFSQPLFTNTPSLLFTPTHRSDGADSAQNTTGGMVVAAFEAWIRPTDKKIVTIHMGTRIVEKETYIVLALVNRPGGTYGDVSFEKRRIETAPVFFLDVTEQLS